MTQDFAPISNDDWPADIADLLSGFAGGLNVHRTMAHHPALLRAWADLREHVVNQTSLGAEHSEVVILRTGHQLRSSDEWHQHIVRARKAGLSDDGIDRLGKPLHQVKSTDATFVRAVDELILFKRLAPDTQSTLNDIVGKHGVLGVIATVGFYSTLGYILNRFDVPLDDDIIDNLRSNPFKD